MMRQELLELIHNEVDGENRPAESARLREMLARDPEAAQLLEDLRRLSNTLGAAPRVDAPATLKGSVMREIQLGSRMGRRHSSRSLLERLRQAIARHAYAFASGLAAGVALLALYMNVAPVAPGDASGSIFWPPTLTALRGGETVDFSRLRDFPEGSLSTQFGDSLGVVRLQVRSGAVAARLSFDPALLMLDGVIREPGFHGTVTLREGEIEASEVRGSCSFIFMRTTPKGDGLRVQLLSGERGRYEGELSFAPRTGQ